MPFSNFNPPFTNKNLEDFFDFKTKNQAKANILKEWVLSNFSNLKLGLAYHVPFFFLDKKKIFYFHYFEQGKNLELEISFVNGNKIKDTHNLFQNKNKNTKSIHIQTIDNNFLDVLKMYIDESLNIAQIPSKS